jgi:putative SOS response-associated peptidase YedK
MFDFILTMNFKYILVSSLEVIEKRFNVRSLHGLTESPKSYSIDSGDNSCVIVDPNSVQIFQYGLTPHFASEPMNITTARSEGNKNKIDNPGYNGSKAIFLQKEFMKPIVSQRCIVVADAFYECSDTNQHYLSIYRIRFVRSVLPGFTTPGRTHYPRR